MIIFFILSGLCFGSFIYVAYCRFDPNLTGYRYLWSIAFLRSHCPKCHHKLAAWQLIPLISWCCLKGRCFYCQHKIDAGYLFVELLTATLFALVSFDRQIDLHSMTLLLLTGWFILLSLIDVSYFLLPDFLTQPLMWLGIILAFFDLSTLSLDMALIGIAIGYLLLTIPATLFYLRQRKQGLGGGDIKLLAALGAWIPYLQLPLLLIIACLLAILYYCFLRRAINKAEQVIIPFGPFLLIAAISLLNFPQSMVLFLPNYG